MTKHRTLICCLLSALAGGLLVQAWEHLGSTATPAQAQQAQAPLQAQTPGFSAPPNAQAFGEARRDAAGEAQPGGELLAEEQNFIRVYEAANQSVVNISTKSARSHALFAIESPSEGMGSGSILDKQGHVLTNFHVVEGAREIDVTLFDGSTWSATLVGEDPQTDIAVLRITAPAELLFPVTIADSTHLRVGQRVLAIGNPFGLERTLTAGIISSLNRSFAAGGVRRLKSLIQVDAAINPGNSGGPLLDSRGRLIGMNTAIASRTGQSAGVGFAIPSSNITQVVPQLLRNGRVIRADIGIVRVFQLKEGLMIDALVPGGPAEQAGLRGPQVVQERQQRGPFTYERRSLDRSKADLITAVDGVAVRSGEAFLTAIESKRPGEEVTLSIIRQGQPQQVRVRLGESRE